MKTGLVTGARRLQAKSHRRKGSSRPNLNTIKGQTRASAKEPSVMDKWFRKLNPSDQERWFSVGANVMAALRFNPLHHSPESRDIGNLSQQYLSPWSHALNVLKSMFGSVIAKGAMELYDIITGRKREDMALGRRKSAMQPITFGEAMDCMSLNTASTGVHAVRTALMLDGRPLDLTTFQVVEVTANDGLYPFLKTKIPQPNTCLDVPSGQQLPTSDTIYSTGDPVTAHMGRGFILITQLNDPGTPIYAAAAGKGFWLPTLREASAISPNVGEALSKERNTTQGSLCLTAYEVFFRAEDIVKVWDGMALPAWANERDKTITYCIFDKTTVPGLNQGATLYPISLESDSYREFLEFQQQLYIQRVPSWRNTRDFLSGSVTRATVRNLTQANKKRVSVVVECQISRDMLLLLTPDVIRAVQVLPEIGHFQFAITTVAEAEQLLGPMSLQAKRLAVQEEYVLLLPGKRDQLEFHLQLPASLQWNQANEQFAYLSWDVAKIHMGNVVWNTRAVKHCQKKQIQEEIHQELVLPDNHGPHTIVHPGTCCIRKDEHAQQHQQQVPKAKRRRIMQSASSSLPSNEPTADTGTGTTSEELDMLSDEQEGWKMQSTPQRQSSSIDITLASMSGGSAVVLRSRALTGQLALHAVPALQPGTKSTQRTKLRTRPSPSAPAVGALPAGKPQKLSPGSAGSSNTTGKKRCRSGTGKGDKITAPKGDLSN